MAYELTPTIPILDEYSDVAREAFIAGEEVTSGANVDFQWASTTDMIGDGCALYILLADGPEEPEPSGVGKFPLDPLAEPVVCLANPPQTINLCETDED